MFHHCASACSSLPFHSSRWFFHIVFLFCWVNWYLCVFCARLCANPFASIRQFRTASARQEQLNRLDRRAIACTQGILEESGDTNRWMCCSGCKEKANTSLWIRDQEDREIWREREWRRRRRESLNCIENKFEWGWKRMARQAAAIFKKSIQLNKTLPGCSPNYQKSQVKREKKKKSLSNYSRLVTYVVVVVF